ncbi:molecular chaperone TorD family protein [Candidatus Parabeggiatoa sp. HSG14]|uniref:nitrate reductase molybdenum cofactor assembly chaperone n=1 Tax=Candidatus Parabeggiatoa sp. HSG14 TaxID=3055593 RepID=UPI0025A91C8A|nr:molecular chaperone TorD family protein [Thiotrichales bacterium HSG14]
MEEAQQQQFYRCFSDLLDYPKPNLVEQTRTCIDELKKEYPQMAKKMGSFLNFVESTPSGRLEEIYTGTFDINPACYIYAGHILFGESFKRGAFMAKLSEEYQNRNFDKGTELADHVPILFNFLGTLDKNDSFADSLIFDCLIPVFQKMNTNFKDNSSNPYMPVLRSALVVLEGVAGNR